MKFERNALVWGIVGNLGGGKTLSAVSFGVQAMREGYFVVSNVTFKLDKICDFFGDPQLKNLYQHISLDDPDFDPFKLPCGSPRGTPGGKRVLVIFDEVAEWFDQYSKVDRDPRVSRILSWLRHSSKRSQDVIIICQRREYINKNVRSLIARWVWVDDLAVWRMPKIKIRLPFCSGLVVQNFFDRLGERVQPCCFVKKSFWGQFYDTAECLNNLGAQYNTVYELPASHFVPSSFTVLLWFATMIYLIYNVL